MGAARWLSCSGVSALLAVLATLLLVQPANAQEEDPCATAPLGIGGFGTDTLDGGTGNDLLFGGQNGDLINGGPGDDLLVGDIPNMASEDGLPPTVDPRPTSTPASAAAGPTRPSPASAPSPSSRRLSAQSWPGHQTWRPGPPGGGSSDRAAGRRQPSLRGEGRP